MGRIQHSNNRRRNSEDAYEKQPTRKKRKDNIECRSVPGNPTPPNTHLLIASCAKHLLNQPYRTSAPYPRPFQTKKRAVHEPASTREGATRMGKSTLLAGMVQKEPHVHLHVHVLAHTTPRLSPVRKKITSQSILIRRVGRDVDPRETRKHTDHQRLEGAHRMEHDEKYTRVDWRSDKPSCHACT